MKKDSYNWNHLDYWNSGEWQVVDERLREISGQWCPGRHNLFAVLNLPGCFPDRVRVMVIGQDPYPQKRYATGIAFSIPREERQFPPTLINIFQEYQDDLNYPCPSTGDLRKWTQQGVLLWNAYPSVEAGKPGSHHWDEWTYLTKELVERLSEKDVVFILLGKSARQFSPYCSKPELVIETSHPSPMGAKQGFLGSRVFSRANDLLREKGVEEIDWRLD